MPMPTMKQIRQAHSWKREYEKYLPLSRFFYRPVGFFLTWISVRMGISTEAVSWLSFISGICGLLLIMGKGILCIWCGIGLLLLFNLLDCVDGSVARVMRTENPYGKLLDSVLGDAVDFPFFIVVGIMVYRHPSLMGFDPPLLVGVFFGPAFGVMTGLAYIMLRHTEQLFHYQIRGVHSKTGEGLSNERHWTQIRAYEAKEIRSKSVLRVIDRNLRVRETHYFFLIIALLMKSVDVFLMIFFAYYMLHLFITSAVFFRRAKKLRKPQ
jgi:phosphatidylserine synthase